MEQILSNELYKSIAIAIAILFILWLLFSSSENDSKKNEKTITLKDLNLIFSQNKEIVNVGKYLDFISNEFNEKRRLVEDLEDEILQTQLQLDKEKRKVEFVKSSPELKELQNVKDELSRLEEIKKSFKEINRTQANRFKIVLLINMIKQLYKELHNIELSVQDIEDMLNDYVDSGDNSSAGDSNEVSRKKKLVNTRNKINPRTMS